MGWTFSGLNTATLGLAAQQNSLNTVGHNISNANTDGYSRQRVNLTATDPEKLYANGSMHFLGTGVTIESITRARDAFLDRQYWNQNSTQNYWKTQSDNLGKLEDIFYESKTLGVQYSINNFSTALQTLATNAGDPGARTNVREMGNALVTTLQQDGQHLSSLADDITGQISTNVTNVNSLASQIAALNKEIVKQEASGATANDLRDQRDLLMDKLSALTTTNVTEDADGNYIVSISGGITLVQGGTATKLVEQNAVQDPLYGYKTHDYIVEGTTVTVNFKGGELQSLVEMRDKTVRGNLDDLDKMAQYLLQDFNAQHRAGYDNNGAIGGNFFGQSDIDYSTGKAQFISNLKVTNPATPMDLAGSFDVNGTTVDVLATDSLNDIVTKINGAGAGVTASIASTGQLMLTQDTAGSAYGITISNDTLKARIAGTITPATPVTATAGSFDINGVTIPVAVGDNLSDIVATINTLVPDVTADISSGRLRIIQNTGGSANSITINNDVGGMFAALGLTAGTVSGADSGLMPSLGLATGTTAGVDIPPVNKSWLSELEVNQDFYATGGGDLIAVRSKATSETADGTNGTNLSDVLLNKPAAPTAALGKDSLLTYYQSMISSLGVNSQQAQKMAANEQNIVSSTANRRQAISGVSMDEEMSNMIRFQTAYGAAAKIITTLNAMYDSLLNSV